MNGRLNGRPRQVSDLRADLDFAGLASASWSDTTYTVNGVDVLVVNSARADTIGPDGSTGVVMDPKSGTTHEADARDTCRLEIDLADLFEVGEWYLNTPMWVVLEFASALDPAGATTRTMELGVDTGTGAGSGVNMCSCLLRGAAGGPEAGGFRSVPGGDVASAMTALEPAWIGILIEPANVQAFGNTGAAPSSPLLVDHLSPAAGLSVTAAQSPGSFTVEAAQAASRNVYVAVAGKWSTAPVLKRLRCYTLAAA